MSPETCSGVLGTGSSPVRVITQKDLRLAKCYQDIYQVAATEFIDLVRSGKATVEAGELLLLDCLPTAVIGTVDDLERERQRLREQFNAEVNVIRSETNHSTASARSLQGLCDLADAIWHVDKTLIDLCPERFAEYSSKVFFRRFRILLARHIPSYAVSLLAA